MDGKLIALDFGATRFLPRCFWAYVMANATNNFALDVVKRLTSPASDNVVAMRAAASFLVPHGKNTMGQPDSFHFT